MNKKFSISIAIPCYNEAENIEWVVNNTFKSLPKYFKDYEVIVVNDGSSDKTQNILERLEKKHDSLKVINQANSGFSKAMLAGIMASKKDYVAYMPADGQFLVDDMRHCFEKLGSADLILGYRGSRPDYTKYRMILSYGYLLLLLFFFNIQWIDIGWVFIWNTKKIQSIKFKYLGGIFMLTESVVKFQKKGWKIEEAPSYYRPRRAGQVKNAKYKVVRDTFISTIRLWLDITSSKN